MSTDTSKIPKRSRKEPISYQIVETHRPVSAKQATALDAERLAAFQAAQRLREEMRSRGFRDLPRHPLESFDLLDYRGAEYKYADGAWYRIRWERVPDEGSTLMRYEFGNMTAPYLIIQVRTPCSASRVDVGNAVCRVVRSIARGYFGMETSVGEEHEIRSAPGGIDVRNFVWQDDQLIPA